MLFTLLLLVKNLIFYVYSKRFDSVTLILTQLLPIFNVSKKVSL